MATMDPQEPVVDSQAWKPTARLALARLGSGLWAGFLSGAIIGGVGGRLAMFLLRVTSDPSLAGMETDDGFVIGSFTSDTMFLVIITAIAGLLGGLFYLAIRGWIPPRLRPAITAALTAAVIGSLVVKPEGIDFTLIEPLSLAIALFVVIPALYGLSLSLITEKLLTTADERSKRGLIVSLLAVLPALALGPLGILLVILISAGWFIGWGLDQYFPLTKAWGSPAVTWIGRTGLAVLFLFSLTALIKDSIEIL